MKNLDLIVRKDLSMPRGKMGAQVAHAALKLCLEQMKPVNENLYKLAVSDAMDLEAWLATSRANVSFVKGEQALYDALSNEEPNASIVDNGKTHFDGQRTLTCAAQGLFNARPELESSPVDQILTEQARQYFLISDEHNIGKEDVCALTVKLCLMDFMDSMQQDSAGNLYLDRTPGRARADWLGGAFTKICLRVESNEELLACAGRLKAEGLAITLDSVDLHSGICVEPMYAEQIQPLLSHYRPLMGW